jgi:hypothetical protein
MKTKKILLLFSLLIFNNIQSQSFDTIQVNINNVKLPLFNDGRIGPWGIYDSVHFLYSAGFFLTGKSDDLVWSNGIQESDDYLDYLPGKYNSDKEAENNKFYVLKSIDTHFGQEWQDWKNAVEMGAYFYDGDADGLYNPVDLDGNGVWNEGEDRPDLLGDFTSFTVFNDGKPSNERYFQDVSPQGIEMKQTTFAYLDESNEIINNVIFLRYIIENVGDNNVLDSVAKFY